MSLSSINSSVAPTESSPNNLSLPKPSKLTRLLQKIRRLVSSIFCCFSCTGNVKHFFNPREITLLRSPGHPQPLSPPASSSGKKVAPINPKDKNSSGNQTAKKEPIYHAYDDSLEGMREFLRELACLSIDVLHDKHLKAQLETVQKAAPNVANVKSIAMVLVEIGDKAAKPFYQKFSSH
jgi:hypothetical protein